MMLSRRTFGLGLGVAAATPLGTRLRAQTQWPNQVIRLVIPFPPGNTADLVARVLQPGLAARLGQPVIVENRAGAGGVVGTDNVAKSTDQHSFLLTTASPLVINPAVYKSLSYNVDRDFSPIIKIGSISVMLIGTNGLPATTTAELMAHIKANPGKLDYASVGAGTFTHLTMEMFRRQSGLDIQHVPFRGAGAAHTELIAGRISLMFDSIASANAQVQAGSVKAFAVASAQRSQFAPNVPTLAESKMQGLQDFDVSVWIGLLGPASTPKELVARLDAAVRAELSSKEVAGKLSQQSITLQMSSTPDEFAKLVQIEKSQWTKVAKEINLELL